MNFLPSLLFATVGAPNVMCCERASVAKHSLLWGQMDLVTPWRLMVSAAINNGHYTRPI